MLIAAALPIIDNHASDEVTLPTELQWLYMNASLALILGIQAARCAMR